MILSSKKDFSLGIDCIYPATVALLTFVTISSRRASSGQVGFQEHKVMDRDRVLYVVFIRLQADKTAGRSYAGLPPFVEGLFYIGCINREVYEKHVQKYSDKLIGKKQLTIAESQETEKNAQLARCFKAVAEQWETLRRKQCATHLKKALSARGRVPEAGLIIQLAKKEVRNK